MSTSLRRLLAAGATTALAAGALACAVDTTSPGAATHRSASIADAQALADAGLPAGVHRQYGTPVALGQGRARTYVVVDERDGRRMLELGVAFDERAMDGLRGPDLTRSPHADHDMYELPFPTQHASAFRMVELDWNPRGHDFPHDSAHFDVHFYAISRAERDAIMPSDPQYAARAANAPPAADVPAYYVNPATALGLPPVAVAAPMMGIHWVDARSPELQLFPGGDPTKYRPFTRTFIYGAWDGRFTFMEPMVTRTYLVGKRSASDAAQRDEVIPIPTSPSFPSGAFRPDAYRIAYDAQAKEYRVALTMAAGLQ